MKDYDSVYDRKDAYWGVKPSTLCFEVVKHLPYDRPVHLLDVGCGEGRDAVFFARLGCRVTAFDSSLKGVEKTQKLADRNGVNVDVFQADIREFRLTETVDVVFSSGVIHCIPPDIRRDVIENYQTFTKLDGLNAFLVFVEKPFIEKAPDYEHDAQLWRSGELFSMYHDWRFEHCAEDIFNCMSSGVPHQHAVNRLIARRMQ